MRRVPLPMAVIDAGSLSAGVGLRSEGSGEYIRRHDGR